MGQTTGPILAVGGLTLAADLAGGHDRIDPRVVLGTTVAAVMLGMAERAWPDGARALAWAALVTVMFVRVREDRPAPAEVFVKVLNLGAAGGGGTAQKAMVST